MSQKLLIILSIRWHFDVVAVIDIPFPAGSCFLSKQRPTQPTKPESKITFASERFSQNYHNFTQILQLKIFQDKREYMCKTLLT